MKASNLKVRQFNNEQSRLAIGTMSFIAEHIISEHEYGVPALTVIPVLWVKSEAEAVSDTPCSPLPLEGAGFGNKGLHQRTHLTALMVSAQHNRLESPWSQMISYNCNYKSLSTKCI